MTPKEQAEQLTNKFLLSTPITCDIEDAKICALLAVDGIIDALSEYDNRNNTYELQNMDRDFNYWQQVKQEIEKL